MPKYSYEDRKAFELAKIVTKETAMTSMDALNKKLDKVLDKLNTHDVKFEVLNTDISVTRICVEGNSKILEKFEDTMKDKGKTLDETVTRVAVVEDNVSDLKTKSNFWNGLNSFGIAIITTVQIILGKN